MGEILVCQAIDVWTFSELVGAFLNLAIAYFLLCGSALAYFVSKFLGFFGSSLPCTCNGHFGKPTKTYNYNCWQGFLVDCPTKKISNFQFLAKTKFPFDSIFANDLNCQSKERGIGKEHVASEGETSCASSSQVVIGRESKEGNFEYKGKVVKSRSSRHGIRRRRKSAFGNEKAQSFSSFDQLISDGKAVLASPGSFSKIENEIREGSLAPIHLGYDAPNDSTGASKEDKILPSDTNEHFDDNITVEKDVSSVDVIKRDLQGQLGIHGDDINAVKEALEIERAARSALCLELEKERSAAASAADEAMAMIFRLQEEKASIEMEGRQYQRMIEEKSAYDAEEMNILKEILIRRERENHFLEKEVESLRQMLFCADTEDTSTTQRQTATSLYYNEDPQMMFQQITNSIVEKEKVTSENDFLENEITSIESQNYTLTLGKESLNLEFDGAVHSSKTRYIQSHPNFDDHHQHEKGMLSVNKNPIDQPKEMQILAECSQFNHSTTQILNIQEKTIIPAGEMQEQTDELQKNMEASVYDVQVIGEELNTGHICTGSNRRDLSKNLNLDIPTICDSPVTDGSDTEVDRKRSHSELPSRQLSFSPGKIPLNNLRRNSMSAFDIERLKIDNEVGFLRERLKIVQEGREKLNFSRAHRGRENIQLQLLEDIACQLREIRQLTEPGKAASQASLPPLSSKAVSKKRRSRSISLVSQKTA